MQVREFDLHSGSQLIRITEDTELRAVFVGKDKDGLKCKLEIIHPTPHITSRINIKAVVFDQAKFDLEAKLVIEQAAMDTDTYLKVGALIMSDTATARAVPSLEIKTDNVKGGHGATIGQVDEAQLYYLMSRGFSHSQAESLLVEAYLTF